MRYVDVSRCDDHISNKHPAFMDNTVLFKRTFRIIFYESNHITTKMLNTIITIYGQRDQSDAKCNHNKPLQFK